MNGTRQNDGSPCKAMKLQDLQELYRTHQPARLLFDHAVRRNRSQLVTKVRRMLINLEQEGHDIDRADLVDAFRRLEKLGAGQFVAGKNEKSDCFVWKVNMMRLGRRAAGLAQDSRRFLESQSAAHDFRRLIMHKFPLRADLPVIVGLPIDLKPNEADRLAAFLKTLPLSEDAGA